MKTKFSKANRLNYGVSELRNFDNLDYRNYTYPDSAPLPMSQTYWDSLSPDEKQAEWESMGGQPDSGGSDCGWWQKLWGKCPDSNSGSQPAPEQNNESNGGGSFGENSGGFMSGLGDLLGSVGGFYEQINKPAETDYTYSGGGTPQEQKNKKTGLILTIVLVVVAVIVIIAVVSTIKKNKAKAKTK